MSIETFLAKAKESSTVLAKSKETLTHLYDVSTEAFNDSIDALDSTTTSRSITDDQYRALKKLIAEYREEIMQGNFVATKEKLHTITIWYRVLREEAFIVIKEKPVKEKKTPTGRTRKPKIIINDLM